MRRVFPLELMRNHVETQDGFVEEAIRASEGQDPLEGEATRSLPVYIVRVSRSNYGRILEHNKFTSFPH